jgi:hypothetical protein
MKQLRIILAVSAVILGAAAVWAWQSEPPSAEPTVARAAPSAPLQQSPFPTPTNVVASDAATTPEPAPAAKPQEAPVVADIEPPATSSSVEPPNVDTPEPAQRKFARGGHGESNQN